MSSFATIVGLILVTALSVWTLIAAFLLAIAALREYRQRPPYLDRLPSDIAEMGRWLGYDFPIAEDIELWLQERAQGKGESISDLRDRLRGMYGTRRAGGAG